MLVPNGAVPEMTTLFPVDDRSSAPTTGPAVTVTGVAAATCPGVDARSNTVIHSRLVVWASVGRTSIRHILFHVLVSVEPRRWSVVTILALTGKIVVIDPANIPGFTSKRCNPVAGGATSTGFAGKWNASY